MKFDRIYRAPLGLYLSAFCHRGRFMDILSNWPSHNVQASGPGGRGAGGRGWEGIHGQLSTSVCLQVWESLHFLAALTEALGDALPSPPPHPIPPTKPTNPHPTPTQLPHPFNACRSSW